MTKLHCYHPHIDYYGREKQQCCWCGVTRHITYLPASHEAHGLYYAQPVWFYDYQDNQPYFAAVPRGRPDVEPECIDRIVYPDAPMLSQKGNKK